MFQLAELAQICRDVSESGLDAPGLANRAWLREPATALACRLPLAHPHADDRFFFGKPRELVGLNYPLAPVQLHSLPYASLMGPAWAIASHDGYLLKDSYFNDGLLQESGHFLRQQLRIDLGGGAVALPFALYRGGLIQRELEDEAYLPLYYWHFNYHHWLIECLPLIDDFVSQPRYAGCKLILPAKLNAFQRASLELYGIDFERVIAFDAQALRLKRLYLPSLGNFSPGQLQRVRDGLMRRAGLQKPARGHRRIYVSRADAGSRRLLNEAGLRDILLSRGFEIHSLSGMPLREQMQLFSEAAVILGPHGAGLSNTIFAPAESLLIELAPHDQINHCFWLLTNSLGQPYTYLTGPVSKAERDFSIAPEKLQGMLDSLGIVDDKF